MHLHPKDAVDLFQCIPMYLCCITMLDPLSAFLMILKRISLVLGLGCL